MGRWASLSTRCVAGLVRRGGLACSYSSCVRIDVAAGPELADGRAAVGERGQTLRPAESVT